MDRCVSREGCEISTGSGKEKTSVTVICYMCNGRVLRRAVDVVRDVGKAGCMFACVGGYLLVYGNICRSTDGQLHSLFGLHGVESGGMYESSLLKLADGAMFQRLSFLHLDDVWVSWAG